MRMKQKTTIWMAACVLALMALVLTGCGNVSQGVKSNGQGADVLVWPDPDSVTPIHKGGTYPETAQLQLLRYGMNKQQIAMLVGYPHFSEGVWAVREWNYMFNFRMPDSDRIEVCQFKVLFDEDKLARRFDWHPDSCARHMAVPVSPTTAPSVSSAQAPEQMMTLSADALFAFDRSSVADITDEGRQQLDQLARVLVKEKARIEAIHIRGYADRLGSDAYDDALSEHRAYAVMDDLVAQGVPQALMVAEGHGKSDAVKDCPELSRATLIACLAPNRRVEVQVRVRPIGQAE
jgi:OmpA-OmpF porin, OOP family